MTQPPDAVTPTRRWSAEPRPVRRSVLVVLSGIGLLAVAYGITGPDVHDALWTLLGH